MRASIKQKRFSKRRSKRKTSFPLIAIIPKKFKPNYMSAESFFATFDKSGSKLRPGPVGPWKNKKSPVVRSGKDVKKSRAVIDYKNVILLRKLITAEGKILPRRINKLTAKQQRYTSKAIKSARILGFLPFINKIRPI
jgi:small subunit ribosomal protein S18